MIKRASKQFEPKPHNTTLDGINARNKAYWDARGKGATTDEALKAASLVIKPTNDVQEVASGVTETKPGIETTGDVGGFEANGEFHPIRSSEGYKPSKAGEKKKKAKKKKKR